MLQLTNEALVLGRFAYNGISLILTRNEMAILNHINSMCDSGSTIHELSNLIWGELKHTKTLGVHMLNLRRKLETAGLKVEYRPTNKTYELKAAQ
jgi:DNA-binding response OmpR family regulator